MNLLITEHKNLSSNPTKNDRAVTVLDSTSVILCSHYLVTSFEMHHYFENIYYYVICSLVLQVLDSL